MKKNFFAILFSFFIGIIFIGLFTGCASKEIPVKEEPKKPQFAFIQITDGWQISFAELPCSVFFADGRIETTKTDVEGKILLKGYSDTIVEKVIYDFTDYKRVKGRFLAKEDFRIAKKIKTNPDLLKKEFILNFTPKNGAKVIFILDIF